MVVADIAGEPSHEPVELHIAGRLQCCPVIAPGFGRQDPHILEAMLGKEQVAADHGGNGHGQQHDEECDVEPAEKALQFRSSDVDEILDWTREMLDWPVIVKPPRSVGSDQVFCCQNSDEVRKAAVSILSDMNMLGASNTEAIVQEFLEGTEYVIDMVSVDAQPKLTAVWQYDRPKGAREFIAYDAMRLIPYDGQRQTALRDYASEVLKALGICFGPSHCEMIWREDGPVLVEIGARLTTGMNAVLSRICGGICHLDETVSAIMEPEMFLTTLDTQPELQQYAANVFLVPPHPGKLIRTRHLEDLRALPTLHSMSVATQRGDELKRVAGLLILIGSDPQAIDRDIGIIRSYERDGIFEVEESGS